MSTAAAINWTIAIVLFLLALLTLGLCRAAGRASRAEEAYAARRVWENASERWVDLPPGAEPAPGQMTRDELTAADPLDLTYLAPAYGPDLDARLDRLRQAVRDEQQKGDQP